MNCNHSIFFFEDHPGKIIPFVLAELQLTDIQKDTVFVTDTNTAKNCFPHLWDGSHDNSGTRLIVIPTGEDAKSMNMVSLLIEHLLRLGATRSTLLINLGGGVVSDLGGFVASIYKRGIPYINIPTSLLAMVDAAVGGKTGVNFNHHKNLIGSFCFPEMVCINPVFLKTLPDDHWRSGLGELFKYALISDDFDFEELRTLNRNDDESLLSLIGKSLNIKQQLVCADPYDRKERHLLNVGHTIGHAFESACVEAGIRITHGEAVAAGIVAECYLSNVLEGFPDDRLKQINSLFASLFAPFIKQCPDPQALQKFMLHDKKNERDAVNAILFDIEGRPVMNRPLPPHHIADAIHSLYQSIHESR